MTGEQAVIQRAKAGDELAFEELVFAYEKKVYNMALRYTGSEHDACDISQEVFLRVFRFLPRFHEDSQFSTWLYRITSNVCKDFSRKKHQHPDLSLEAMADEEDGFSLEVADLRYNPEIEAERMAMREELKLGLLSLTDSHREILILRDVTGMSYEEIGKALSLEQGTVKSRIARARDRLRIFLTEKGNKPVRVSSKASEGRDGT